MKRSWSRTVNVVMGLLLLITFSYSIPSTSPQRNIQQTEWVKNEKQSKNELTVRTNFFQVDSFLSVEFSYRIFDFNNRIETCFRLNKSFQFSYNPPRLTQSKIISNDDDYLLS